MSVQAAMHAVTPLDSGRPRRHLGRLIEETHLLGGSVCVHGTFLTREDAEEAIAEYLSRFQPIGYGTGFREIAVEHGYFIVRGRRSGSCD